MKSWKITTFAIALSLILGACFPTPTPPPAPTDTPAPTPTLHPCASAQIVTPIGAMDEVNAEAHKVDSEITIQWVPSGCVLTVQSYQNYNLVTDTKEVVSGTTLKIGEPGSGKTEIKIWWKDYSRSIWVSIK
jgi:hypothetical protein